ncbi:GntR family transcriptional regulator [Thiothrix subterranea]|uniref:GntR family transcriptional regulator n=1 Tax=Thiothrix subterranea TaxID=2735563 RepID=UPI00280BB860|nr:GntR family transcriptional regulator [Thiothrix subterranea]
MNTYYIKASNAVEIIVSLEEQIRLGVLKPGESLPAIRELAQQIGVSPNTVATAYAKLRDAGLVVSDGRRGTTVALPPSHGDMLTELPAGLIDLASGNVDGNLLPSLNAAWLARQGSLTGYDASGDASCLLDVARHWLTKEHLPSAEMGVFSGTLEAIAIALRLRVTPGRVYGWKIHAGHHC